ncbi:hypothetical protein SAMN04244572_03727 [Azotobacter beijerinckii]|uniref:Helix-turn-helix domain-containing protein n=2 Tax=Azotobacter beijerinckii TaxID=170623 RepID=A0A1H6YK71_9GAMM|nr:helix-turn-helix domain-containing protein [Azotobacter beijerinckii]SEJ37630.1 hypothetical protein SAMN04244572_03727 [Azotobacter beijerinckii]
MSDDVRKYHQSGTRGTWVQTERAGHEAWAQLIHHAPRAAQLLHVLVANMDERGALVASQATLSKLTGVSVATTKRALAELIKGQWIQTIRIGGERGGTLAYVVNSRIAWADSRENLKLARFTARVLISSEDQADLGGEPLQQVPALAPGELQLPAGEGGKPPAQESLEGMLPDLPSLPNPAAQ